MNLWDPTCFRVPVCLLLIPRPLFPLFFPQNAPCRELQHMQEVRLRHLTAADLQQVSHPLRTSHLTVG